LFEKFSAVKEIQEISETPSEIKLLMVTLEKQMLPYVNVKDAIIKKQFVKGKLLYFIKGFGSVRHKIEGFKHLMDIIKSNRKIDDPEVLEIAFSTKQLFEDCDPKYLGELKALKAEFPESVQNIIWERVYIQNVHWNVEFGCQTFLCANTFGHVFDSPNQDQKLYLAITKRTPSEGAEWIFDSTDEGRTFFIKNALTNESLFATPRTFTYWTGSRKCHAAFASKGDEFKWKISSDDGATKFLFENKFYGEFFRSNTNIAAEGKQYVFAWNSMWDGCYWKIVK
jgi:hypothetical protein